MKKKKIQKTVKPTSKRPRGRPRKYFDDDLPEDHPLNQVYVPPVIIRAKGEYSNTSPYGIAAKMLMEQLAEERRNKA